MNVVASLGKSRLFTMSEFVEWDAPVRLVHRQCPQFGLGHHGFGVGLRLSRAHQCSALGGDEMRSEIVIVVHSC